ncbi:MAG: hypothetical protein HW390_443 [Candidatus Brocadiaceae bacterium]|nr:hypothetical protein [Candidatus Brocadiaceae bacterium]
MLGQMVVKMKTSTKTFWKLRKLRTWFLGLVFLAGLVYFVTHFRELEHFVQLLHQAKPLWLLAGLFVQSLTYFSAAAVWQQTFLQAGVRYSLLSLVPLGIAKLFSDQALPSGGVSGSAFLVASLNRRGIPPPLCMAMLLTSMVAYYTAYLVAALSSIALLWFYHAIKVWIVTVTGAFCVIAVIIPVGSLWLKRLGKQQSLPALVAFPSFVVASVVATLSPVPLGLGTFEATCVAMLSMLGVTLEAAFTATLLLRGFTLWLPMIPGLWLTKLEMR